ncbi:hypothetical protein, partial [Bacillus mycoides]|uniref:hypothetical protein n=1 Tax=Bacillus mycoides TaxID=1405 RepID=UPI00366214A2
GISPHLLLAFTNRAFTGSRYTHLTSTHSPHFEVESYCPLKRDNLSNLLREKYVVTLSEKS